MFLQNLLPICSTSCCIAHTSPCSGKILEPYVGAVCLIGAARLEQKLLPEAEILSWMQPVKQVEIFQISLSLLYIFFQREHFFPMKNVEGMKGRLHSDFYGMPFPTSNFFQLSFPAHHALVEPSVSLADVKAGIVRKEILSPRLWC